jgi:hypothetical protein
MPLYIATSSTLHMQHVICSTTREFWSYSIYNLFLGFNYGGLKRPLVSQGPNGPKEETLIIITYKEVYIKPFLCIIYMYTYY